MIPTLQLLLLSLPAAGPAAASPLAARLLAATEACRAMFEEDSDLRPEEIKDVRNGYVRIAGSYPTCGCECAATAAAFKTAAGAYHVLSFETWSCEWKSVFGGDWRAVLPANLRAELAPQLAGHQGEAVFVLHAELPRHGTDVVITVKPIPLGLGLTCDHGICDSVSEAAAKTTTAEDKDEADRRYAASQKLRYERVILKWDRAAGRFTIGERTEARKESRAEFLDRSGRWGPVC